jgi:hypothetical protein
MRPALHLVREPDSHRAQNIADSGDARTRRYTDAAIAPLAAALVDNDAFKSASYTVEPGVGYVEMDCNDGATKTVIYHPADATLRKSCLFRKKSDLGALVISDGAGNTFTINGSDVVLVRRAGSSLVKGPAT